MGSPFLNYELLQADWFSAAKRSHADCRDMLSASPSRAQMAPNDRAYSGLMGADVWALGAW